MQNAVQARYLGEARKKKKVRRLHERKFVFDWDKSETFVQPPERDVCCLQPTTLRTTITRCTTTDTKYSSSVAEVLRASISMRRRNRRLSFTINSWSNDVRRTRGSERFVFISREPLSTCSLRHYCNVRVPGEITIILL